MSLNVNLPYISNAGTLLGQFLNLNATGFGTVTVDAYGTATLNIVGGVSSLAGTANQIAVSSSTGAVTLSLAKNTIIPTPTSGTALAVNGVANNYTIAITSASTGSTNADLYITRPSTTANSAGNGASIDLQDLAATTATVLQHSGGQTELWQYNGSWNQVMYFNTNRGVVINAPASGSALTVNGILTNSGNVLGFILGGTYPSSNTYYKIATLPASTGGTLDSMTIDGTFNNGWASTGTSRYQITLGNRNTFQYRFTSLGTQILGGSGIRCYIESDGSVSVYIVALVTNYSYAYVNISGYGGGATVYPSAMSTPITAPTGTLSFDTTSATYKPSHQTDNSGNSIFNGEVTISPDGITEDSYFYCYSGSAATGAGIRVNYAGTTDNYYDAAIHHFRTGGAVSLNLSGNVGAFSSNSAGYGAGAGAVAGVYLNNTNSSMQTVLEFQKAGVVSGRVRSDYAGNMSYVSTSSGVHAFFVGGDSGVGTNVVSIGSSVQVNSYLNVGSGATASATNGDITATRAGGTTGAYFFANAAKYLYYDSADFQFFGGSIKPSQDNNHSSGTASNRWSVIYSATGTINTSDARLKTNVQDSNLGLNFITKLHPVSYNWIHGTGNDQNSFIDAKGEEVATPSTPGERTHYGLLAQEVKATLDVVVPNQDFAGWTLADKNDSESQQGLRYEQFIAPLIKAVQEQQAQIVAQQAQIDALTTKINILYPTTAQ